MHISSLLSLQFRDVSPNDSVFEVQSVLFNNKISRVVVEKNKQPVGIITYRDFVPAKTFEAYKESQILQKEQNITKSSIK